LGHAFLPALIEGRYVQAMLIAEKFLVTFVLKLIRLYILLYYAVF